MAGGYSNQAHRQSRYDEKLEKPQLKNESHQSVKFHVSNAPKQDSFLVKCAMIKILKKNTWFDAEMRK